MIYTWFKPLSQAMPNRTESSAARCAPQHRLCHSRGVAFGGLAWFDQPVQARFAGLPRRHNTDFCASLACLSTSHWAPTVMSDPQCHTPSLVVLSMRNDRSLLFFLPVCNNDEKCAILALSRPFDSCWLGASPGLVSSPREKRVPAASLSHRKSPGQRIDQPGSIIHSAVSARGRWHVAHI
jgi:hypothetical protein